jgi:cephalosporin hydroxylase
MLRRIEVDLDAERVTVERDEGAVTHGLGEPDGFNAISEAWLRSGWDTKYVYGFSWLGRPIIQLPEDIVRMQELVTVVQPDIVLETGVAHGGSLILHASVCRALGHGRVIGVDIEIRPHNRRAIEAHPLYDLITLVEADSVAPETVDHVRGLIEPGEVVLLILDSAHTRAHVRAELEAYAPLVSPGSYVVVMDGFMESLVGAPRAEPDWGQNNPRRAAADFLAEHDEFQLDEAPFPFNEGAITERVTYAPGGLLKRVR